MKTYLSVILYNILFLVFVVNTEVKSQDTLIYNYTTSITDRSKWESTEWYSEKSVFVISEDYQKIIYLNHDFEVLFNLYSPVEYNIVYINREPIDVWGGTYIYDFGNAKYHFEVYSDGHLIIIGQNGNTYTRLVYSTRKK